MRLKRLSDQTIVVTGATSGIGLVTARMAAERGANLVLVARSEGALEQLTSEIRMKGGNAEFVVADVAKEDELRRASEIAIERFGGFDTWINDAGVLIFGRNEDVSRDDQRKLFETNFCKISALSGLNGNTNPGFSSCVFNSVFERTDFQYNISASGTASSSTFNASLFCPEL